MKKININQKDIAYLTEIQKQILEAVKDKNKFILKNTIYVAAGAYLCRTNEELLVLKRENKKTYICLKNEA